MKPLIISPDHVGHHDCDGAAAPPFITKMLVDEIIPNSDKKMLVTVVAFLFGAPTLSSMLWAHCAGYILRIAGDQDACCICATTSISRHSTCR